MDHNLTHRGNGDHFSFPFRFRHRLSWPLWIVDRRPKLVCLTWISASTCKPGEERQAILEAVLIFNIRIYNVYTYNPRKRLLVSCLLHHSQGLCAGARFTIYTLITSQHRYCVFNPQASTEA